LEGDIDKALKYTNVYYPHVLKDNDHVYFRLRCRKFIEMVRRSAEASSSGSNNNTGSAKKSNGHSFDDVPNAMDVDENGFSDQMDTEDGVDLADMDQDDLLKETIAYGQALQAEFKDDTRREVRKALHDVFALMAYPNPLQVKEIAPLLDRKGRVAVAEELNSAILCTSLSSISAVLLTTYSHSLQHL
jgi:Ran-binding protein 9/10